jgi:hypothetical protein
MPEFVGFQTMEILVLYGNIFDAVGVFSLAFHLLFRSCPSYCDKCLDKGRGRKNDGSRTVPKLYKNI